MKITSTICLNWSQNLIMKQNNTTTDTWHKSFCNNFNYEVYKTVSSNDRYQYFFCWILSLKLFFNHKNETPHTLLSTINVASIDMLKLKNINLERLNKCNGVNCYTVTRLIVSSSFHQSRLMHWRCVKHSICRNSVVLE